MEREKMDIPGSHYGHFEVKTDGNNGLPEIRTDEVFPV